MLFVTWNVNSLVARLPRVVELLETHAPDVVCLQETKAPAGAFPAIELAAAGYQVAHHSAGRWNGVALLARNDLPLRDVTLGLPGEPRPEEARWVEADIGGLRVASVYVPNGRSPDDPVFLDKLAFLDAMVAHVACWQAPALVAGDFNIAPADLDVYDPAVFVGTTHTSAEERERLQRLLDGGMVDLFRHVRPDDQEFTWWDYRAGHFHKGLGMRIDLVLATPDVAKRCARCGIDRTFRKGPKPSDHAPVLMELE